MSQQRAPLTAWRRLFVVAIKVIHSVIFLANSAAILHIFYAGVRNRPSRWTGPALAAALGESLVFVLNRGRCPLTDAVEALGAADGRVSDIFLPRWLADRIPQLCTPPLLIGLAALIVRAGAPESTVVATRSPAVGTQRRGTSPAANRASTASNPHRKPAGFH
jgi:hypothetical protein